MAHASPLPHISSPTFGWRPRLARVLARIEAAFRTHRERRLLMALDDRALHDIGLSRADAEGEWSRPFWDLPKDR